MKPTDPGLVGLFGDPTANKQPSNRPSNGDASGSDPSEDRRILDTAEQFMSRIQDTEQLQPDEPDYFVPDDDYGVPEVDSMEIPQGSILAADGRPFTDFDSALYKARQMGQQTGDEFHIAALSSNQFVVIGSPSNKPLPKAEVVDLDGDGYDDNSGLPTYWSIPIAELKSSDFPADHPVHRCGLARYKKYMRKDFRFKPAYRSMLSLVMIIPVGVFMYLYPIAAINLLPPDVVASMVSSVPPEKLAQGFSFFGAALAAFAAGRVVWQRHVQRYMLHPGFAKHEEGILRRESTKIAYVNIVNYDVKQSILGRLLNYGSLELSSAGSDGSEIEMHNVYAPRLVEVVLEGKMQEAKRANR